MQREPEDEVAGPEAGNSRTHEREGANAADKDGSQSRAADQRADATAAFKLGGLLAERGDLDAAVAAFCLADERGHSAGASNLGMLLEQQGDLEGAEAAYRRADARGHAAGAYNLGALLAERGDLAGAAVALRRAAADTDPEGARMARQALLSLGPSIESHVTEYAASHPTALNGPTLAGTMTTVTTGDPSSVGGHHEGGARDHTEAAEATPTVTSYVPVAIDRYGGSDDGGQLRRNPASLLPLPRLLWAGVLPELLLGVGFTMLAVAIAGLVG